MRLVTEQPALYQPSVGFSFYIARRAATPGNLVDEVLNFKEN